MTSETLLQLLWDQRLDAIRCNYYWSEMTSRLNTRDRALAVLAFVAASATALSVASSIFGAGASKWLALVSLAVSMGSLWMKLARSTTVAGKLLDAASRLQTEYEILWAMRAEISDSEAQSQIEKLMRDNADLAKEAATSLPVDDELNIRSYEFMKAAHVAG